MANEDDYKYVGIRYFVEHQSLWRIPAEWDIEQISVKWDILSYQGQKDPLLAVKMREREFAESDGESYKFPDEEYMGTREELEDNGIWFDCEDGETDSECDSEEPIS